MRIPSSLFLWDWYEGTDDFCCAMVMSKLINHDRNRIRHLPILSENNLHLVEGKSTIVERDDDWNITRTSDRVLSLWTIMETLLSHRRKKHMKTRDREKRRRESMGSEETPDDETKWERRGQRNRASIAQHCTFLSIKESPRSNSNAFSPDLCLFCGRFSVFIDYCFRNH